MKTLSNEKLRGCMFDVTNKASIEFIYRVFTLPLNIVLKPESYMDGYEDLMFDNDETGELRVLA